MQFLLLVYADETLLGKLPAQEFDTEMRQCLEKADDLQASGTLLSFQQLEPASTAKSARARNGRATILDRPFAETKEVRADNALETSLMCKRARTSSSSPHDAVCLA
jgi:hypothetical protein